MVNDDPLLPAPSVVAGEVRRRLKLSPHVLVFANEKGGVGKSTLAFHSSAALSHAGARVLVVDLDNRQKSLTFSLEMREATARILQVKLPTPKFLVLEKQGGAALDREIRGAGGKIDFVIIDLPGADTATARYAITLADTIITPIGTSSYDINSLARTSSVTRKLIARGHFAHLIDQLRNEKVKAGLPLPDWIVMKNRLRAGERRLEQVTDEALNILAPEMGFRIGTGLPESLSFRDLNGYGLTYLDIGLISGIGRRHYKVEKTIGNLLHQYNLPGFERAQPQMYPASYTDKRDRAKVGVAKETSSSYRDCLIAHRSQKRSKGTGETR